MEVVRRGFSTDVRSGVIDMKLDVRAKGEDVHVDAYGPFESSGSTTMPRMQLEVSAAGPHEPVEVTVVTTKDNAYVSYQGQSFELGRDLWRKLMATPDDAPETLGELGIDPEKWVVDADVEGRSTLSGAKVTEVSGTLGLEAILADYNRMTKRFPGGQPLTERQIDTVLDEVDELEFRVWVDDDGVLRRFTTGVEVEGAAIDWDMRIEEPNEPVEIRAPADAQPISELLQRLGIQPDALLGPGAQLPVPG